VGQGELHILESRVMPAVDKDNPGKIEWLRFEVKLKFRSGVTMRDVLGLRAASANSEKPARPRQ